jgi:hypothetical protein
MIVAAKFLYDDPAQMAIGWRIATPAGLEATPA